MNKRFIFSAIAVTSALALSACGGGGGDPLSGGGNAGGSEGSQVIIGSADFTESQLIGSIYSQALQAAGVKVKEQFNIGSREVYIAALKDGSIDLVPEYSGALLSYLDPKSTAATEDAVSSELATKLPSGTSLLTPSPAEDKDVVAVTQATADKYKLKTVSSSAARRNGRRAPRAWSVCAMCTASTSRTSSASTRAAP
jgi:osmoprotectant transport system substrate-binding protein